ncbi:hypothetical protein U1Q18_015035, partial [Sarracenia purpurea var. burkii]
AMEARSFSTLGDTLNQTPSQNSTSMDTLSSQPTPRTEVPHENPHVTEIFGEPYLQESSSSTLPFLLPTPPPPSMPPPPPPPPPPFSSPLASHSIQTSDTEKLNEETSYLEKEKSIGKQKGEENGCIYNKRSLGSNERLFPPPISCLKSMFSTSVEPIVYFRFDESSSSFVNEEMRFNSTQGLLCASRESGRLRLSFVHKEEEEEEEEVMEGGGGSDGT